VSSLRTGLCHCHDAEISRGIPDLHLDASHVRQILSVPTRQFLAQFFRKVLAILQEKYSQTRHIVVGIYFSEYFGSDTQPGC
jgi:hypothetical protein